MNGTSNIDETNEGASGDTVNYFSCESCSFHEKYQYFGCNPPFLKKYKLTEDSFIIKDPFLPSKREEIIVLGAKCKVCSKNVCKDQKCSVYYNKTYCIKCARNIIDEFPEQLKARIELK